MISEGRSIRQLAKKFGISEPTISSWLNRKGIRKLKPVNPPLTSNQYTDQIKHWVNQSWTQKKIAAELGVLPCIIDYWCKKIGAVKITTQDKLNKSKKEIEGWLEQGISVTQICKKLEVSRQNFYFWMKKRGRGEG